MTREDAIEILNTPDEKIDELIAKQKNYAESIKVIMLVFIFWQMLEVATVHKTVPTVPNPVVPMLISTSTAGIWWKVIQR